MWGEEEKEWRRKDEEGTGEGMQVRGEGGTGEEMEVRGEGGGIRKEKEEEG